VIGKKLAPIIQFVRIQVDELESPSALDECVEVFPVIFGARFNEHMTTRVEEFVDFGGPKSSGRPQIDDVDWGISPEVG
jgi:hypothetical protein